MDRYDIVIDIIDHPERYTSGRIEEILSDPEIREVYNLICKTKTAYDLEDGPDISDVDTQWEKFDKSHPRGKFRFPGSARYAASIAAFIVAAVAVAAIGVAVSVRVGRSQEMETQPKAQPSPHVMESANVEITSDSENPIDDSTPILFEDETLDNIMKEVCKAYSVTVSYKSPSTASLRLYYRFDPSLPLTEIVEQLNTFEQITIQIDEEKLIID